MDKKIVQVEELTNARGTKTYRKIIPGGGKPFIKKEEYLKILKENKKVEESNKKNIEKQRKEKEKEIAIKDRQYLEANQLMHEKLKSKIDINKSINTKIKKVKKKVPAAEMERITKFHSEIFAVSDNLASTKLEILNNVEEMSSNDKMIVVKRRFLRLFEKYELLDKDFDNLFKKTQKANLVTSDDEKIFEQLIKKYDSLEVQTSTLMLERKDKEASDKKKQYERRLKDVLGKKSKRTLERSKIKEKQEKDKQKEEVKNRSKEENLVRERQLQALSEEKQKRLAKREKSDKFFSAENSFIKGASKAGGVLGSVIGAPLNAFGFDFADEKQFLSTLFSPLTSLGKFGIGKIKSLSQKSAGIDDGSIDKMDDIFANKGTGLKKKVDLEKVNQRLSGNTPKEKTSSGFQGVKNSLKSVGNFLNPKNISNMFSRNSSSSKASNSQNNYSNTQNSNVNQSSQDYNRTDDNDPVNLDPTNVILNDILKELKDQTKEEKKQGGMFGGGNSKGSKALGLIGKVGLTGLAAGGLIWAGSKLFGGGSNDTSTTTNNNTTNKNTPQNLIEFNKQRNDSSSTFLNSPSKSIKNYFQKTMNEGDSLSQKYGVKGSAPGFANNITNNMSGSIKSADPLMGKDTVVTNSVLRAETKKIEKIKDEQKTNKTMLDDLKKFLSEDFLNSFVEKFAALMINSKGTGRSYMPPSSPF